MAQGEDGSEFVIENQYGKADHDHLTRGLAYAVARRARGLIIVAEEHRDEFKAVAEYLNDLAELDSERGIAVWLIEAKAVRILDSPWAPLFTVAVEPNTFVAKIEQAKLAQSPVNSLDEFWSLFTSTTCRQAAQQILTTWSGPGRRYRLGPNHVVLEAAGPSKNGYRSVVALYADGRVLVPFSSYGGQNSGIPVAALQTEAFRADANALFGFFGGEQQARTPAGWLQPEHLDAFQQYCAKVVAAYANLDGQSLPPIA